jgi:hypothetical protein
METNNVQANASGTFRRHLDAPPPAEPADAGDHNPPSLSDNVNGNPTFQSIPVEILFSDPDAITSNGGL